MAYTTSDFYELSLGGRFELAADWMAHGGNEKQRPVLEKYGLDDDREHDKLAQLFRTLGELEKYRIEMSDVQDNIIDDGMRYVVVDMGF